jgi:hypothetical protein
MIVRNRDEPEGFGMAGRKRQCKKINLVRNRNPKIVGWKIWGKIPLNKEL